MFELPQSYNSYVQLFRFVHVGVYYVLLKVLLLRNNVNSQCFACFVSECLSLFSCYRLYHTGV